MMEGRVTASAVARLVDRIGRRPLAVDIGGRYGLHSPFQPLLGHADIVVYDADSDAEGLDADGVHVVRKALSGGGRERTLFVTRKGGCSSFLRPRREVFALYDGGREYPEMAADRIDVVKQVALETVTLDASLKEIGFKGPDFIKRDVEGVELEILKSLSSLATVSIVEVEAVWTSLRENQPLASEVIAFMHREGFSLWDMQTTFWAMPVRRQPARITYHNKGRAIFSNLLFVNDAEGVDRNVLSLGLLLYGFLAEACHGVDDQALREMILRDSGCQRVRAALGWRRKAPKPPHSQGVALGRSQ